MLSIGSVSVIALLSFLVGKVWSSSEAVFERRQHAYEQFIRFCPHSSEKHVFVENEISNELLATLRDASAATILFASPKVEMLVGQYLFELGQLIAYRSQNSALMESMQLEADQTYTAMLEAMKRDSLGLTWFGIQHRLYRLRAPVNSSDNSKPDAPE